MSPPSDPERSIGDRPTATGSGSMAAAELVGRKLGPYTLDALIGHGGQGAVYRASDGLGDSYAVKVLPSVLFGDDAGEERLRREAKALKGLEHPNIVRFYAFGLEQRFAWLAMQLVDGQSVQAHVRDHGPMSENQARQALQGVLAGLAAAHERGIVHRDLSAGNVLIERTTGRALLADFGLARGESLGTSITGGSPIGTGAYIAPEVYDGGKAGPAADFWAVGILTCQIATGTLPFAAQTTPAMIRAVCDKPPDLTSLRGNLLALARACLEKDPGRRVTDSAEALAILSAATPTEGRDPLPRGPTEGPRLDRNDVLAARLATITQSLATEPPEAIEGTLRTLARQHPSDARVLHVLGRFYGAAERLDESLACYEQAVDCDANDARSHYLLGLAYQRVRQTENAIRSMSRALDLGLEPRLQKAARIALQAMGG